MMANGVTPDVIALEDFRDLPDILEAIGRTIRRDVWADECIEARRIRDQESRDTALENAY